MNRRDFLKGFSAFSAGILSGVRPSLGRTEPRVPVTWPYPWEVDSAGPGSFGIDWSPKWYEIKHLPSDSGCTSPYTECLEDDDIHGILRIRPAIVIIDSQPNITVARRLASLIGDAGIMAMVARRKPLDGRIAHVNFKNRTVLIDPDRADRINVRNGRRAEDSYATTLACIGQEIVAVMPMLQELKDGKIDRAMLPNGTKWIRRTA